MTAPRSAEGQALKPALVGKPWDYVGLPINAWRRLLREGKAPLPVTLPGCQPRWRTAELDAWVAGLPAAKPAEPGQRQGQAAGGDTDAA